jgi:hypothetical protein
MEVKYKLISKSAFLAGLKCPKYLWYYMNEKENIPQPDDRVQFIFDQGHLVGEFAKKLFPGGIEMGYNGDFEENLKRTGDALKIKKPLFEAGIISDGIYCKLYARADILVPSGYAASSEDSISDEVWDIFEVKSSTGIKKINLYDIAFQRYCFKRAGLNIGKCYLVFLNNQYVRNGEIDPEQLFVIADVTDETFELYSKIEENILKFLKIITKDLAEINIGKHCERLFQCPLKESCWAFLPENNVFNLYAGMEKASYLFNSDNSITLIKDIPDDFSLNAKQKIQVECVKNSNTKIKKDAISDFLKKFEYPLYFLDFETFATAVPIFDGIRPYQNIPFQFSLHILKNADMQPEHYSFLHNGAGDPRIDFIEALEKNIGEKGSIVVYYALFEKSILKGLAQYFPQYYHWINSIIERIVDLYEPFGKFDYYHYKQKGSASLKKVLPALTEKSYEDMEISNGELANISFLKISGFFNKLYSGISSNNKNIFIASDDEIAKTRLNLEQYCKLDTEGLIHIMRELGKLVKD